ncbi:MAG: hypothetical protein K9M45_02000 [Kiritimatiellales bacterium]|nr:hypothetical protein [Kiritimatiellales bacterium]
MRRRKFILYVSGAATACRANQGQSEMTRQDVINALRPQVLQTLEKTEQATGLEVQFRQLPTTSAVVATFWFDPHSNTPFISLGKGWADEDVAHELVHMRMELLEGFHVLPGKRRVVRTDELEPAFGRVRCYTDDEVVHAKLARAGFKVDGEVLKPQLFDGFYTDVARYLEEGRDHPNDGMAHLDAYDRGRLCRAAFLVQAELILQNYSNELSPRRIEQTKRFIRLFRERRRSEANKADRILALFKKHDVNTVAGHRAILMAWAEMETLDLYVGLSAYECRNGKYILPWPE